MTLGISWTVTSLNQDQVDFLNIGARSLGFTGAPVTVSDDETHPIFDYIKQQCIEYFTGCVMRQIDLDAMQSTHTDKLTAQTTAGTIA